MFLHRPQQNKLFQYEEAMSFMRRDICEFFMKRLLKHDPAAFRHSVRVALYSVSVADAMGFEPALRTIFLRSALLHDIGKLTLPPELARKRSELSAAEWRLVKRHPVAGAELLHDFIEAGLVMSDIILHHHENLDGSGYPFGVQERLITIPARIVRVADSFDSAVFDSGHLRLKSNEEAFEELYRWSDICFDGQVVRTFRDLMMKSGQETK